MTDTTIDDDVRSTFAEGMKQTWRGHLVLHTALAAITLVVTGAAYAMGMESWVVGLFVFGLLAVGFVGMSGGAIFWLAVGRIAPRDVMRRCAEFSLSHHRLSQGVVLVAFIGMWGVVATLALTWPDDAAVTIAIGDDTAAIPLRVVFQAAAVFSIIPILSMVREFVTSTNDDEPISDS